MMQDDASVLPVRLATKTSIKLIHIIWMETRNHNMDGLVIVNLSLPDQWRCDRWG